MENLDAELKKVNEGINEAIITHAEGALAAALNQLLELENPKDLLKQFGALVQPD